MRFFSKFSKTFIQYCPWDGFFYGGIDWRIAENNFLMLSEPKKWQKSLKKCKFSMIQSIGVKIAFLAYINFSWNQNWNGLRQYKFNCNRGIDCRSYFQELKLSLWRFVRKSTKNGILGQRLLLCAYVRFSEILILGLFGRSNDTLLILKWRKMALLYFPKYSSFTENHQHGTFWKKSANF